jgi:hypothetical protein
MEELMSHLQSWILKATKFFCLWALVLLSYRPAHAQFVPDKGIMASHWIEPTGGLEGYRWLNDKEVLYTHHSTAQYRFFKWDITANKEQELPELSQLVHSSGYNTHNPPFIYPSPDGKYFAWIVGGDTLWVASIDGSVVASHRDKTGVAYPNWSEDGNCCFCFIEGYKPMSGPCYTAIAAIKMNMPFAVTTHSILDAGLLGDTSSGPLRMRLSSVHFKKTGQISLISKGSPRHIDFLGKLTVEEYKLRDSAKLVNIRVLDKLPDGFLTINALFSPTADFIAWRFRNGDSAEIWISDGHGNNMTRLGKLLQKETSLPADGDPSELRWLPGGKGISFREAGELWVVYPTLQLGRH